MAVYFLKHPRPDFTGIMGGVDFYEGKGSTSSLQDANRLLEKGCMIYDEQQRPVTIAAHINPESRREVLEAKAEIPRIDLQGKGAADAAPASSPLPQEAPPVEKTKPKGRPKKAK